MKFLRGKLDQDTVISNEKLTKGTPVLEIIFDELEAKKSANGISSLFIYGTNLRRLYNLLDDGRKKHG